MDSIRKGRGGIDKVKCIYCRRDRQKCQPTERRWPGEKCIRCETKNFPCSKGQRVNRLRYSAPAREQYHAPFPAILPKTSHEPSSENGGITFGQMNDSGPALTDLDHGTIGMPTVSVSDPTQFLLMSSLQSLITMALKELRVLGNDMIHRFRNDPIRDSREECLPLLNDSFKEFRLFHQILELNMNITGDNLLMRHRFMSTESARRDTMWAEDMEEYIRLDARIEELSTLGHHSSAYILQIDRLMEFQQADPEYYQKLIHRKDLFLTEMGCLLNQDALKYYCPPSISKSQMIIPRRLVHHPKIQEDIAKVHLNDCLGRSAPQILLDEGYFIRVARSQVNHTDILGRSLLYIACSRGDFCAVEKLLKYGADATQPAMDGLTPMHVAASLNHTKICRQLSITDEFGGGLLDPRRLCIRDSINRTPLMWAALCGSVDTLDFFCEYAKGSLRDADFHYSTPVGLATCSGHAEVVRRLLIREYPADQSDYYKRSPIWYAAHKGHVNLIKLLDQYTSVDVDRKDHEGTSPLAEACRQGHVKVVRYLLDFDTPIRIRRAPRVNINSGHEEGRTPIILAAKSGSLECIRALCQSQSETMSHNLLDSQDLQRAKDVAIQRNDTAMLQFLGVVYDHASPFLTLNNFRSTLSDF